MNNNTRPNIHQAYYVACACLFSVVLMLGLSSTAAASESPFRDLVDTKGKLVPDLTSVGNGKWTLVMIWATDCHVCTLQKPEISAFYNKHKDANVDVFGIALDGPERLEAVNDYLAEHKPTFPNYVGNYQMMALNYQSLTEENLRGTPTYLLFDPKGELKGNNPGPVTPSAIESFIANHTE